MGSYVRDPGFRTQHTDTPSRRLLYHKLPTYPNFLFITPTDNHQPQTSRTKSLKYRLKASRFEPRQRKVIFSVQNRPDWLWGIQWAGTWSWPLVCLQCPVLEWVEPYLYSPRRLQGVHRSSVWVVCTYNGSLKAGRYPEPVSTISRAGRALPSKSTACHYTHCTTAALSSSLKCFLASGKQETVYSDCQQWHWSDSHVACCPDYLPSQRNTVIVW